MSENEKKVVGRIIKVHKTGWGFISSKEIEFTRIFFHWTALRQDTLKFPEIKTGMYVEFTPLEVPGKGFRAVHVRIIEKPIHVQIDLPELPERGSVDAGETPTTVE